MGAALAGICLAAALTGCGEPPASEDTERAESPSNVRTVPVTGMTREASAAEHIALLPNGEARDAGLIITAIRGGGFDAFNDFGERIFQTAGPVLTSMVAVPTFDMRGTTLSLLFGSDADRLVRGFIVLPGMQAI
ncbi:MAG TPA: hypothetical protein DF715_10730, partial [Oceanicaulis sp.]|nr:hypothetical protein [Oceanicaulis sp.]